MTKCNKAAHGVHEFMDEPYCYHCGEPRPVPMVTVSINKELIFPKTLKFPGNRESRNPGIHIATKNFIINLITELKEGINHD